MPSVNPLPLLSMYRKPNSTAASNILLPTSTVKVEMSMTGSRIALLLSSMGPILPSSNVHCDSNFVVVWANLANNLTFNNVEQVECLKFAGARSGVDTKATTNTKKSQSRYPRSLPTRVCQTRRSAGSATSRLDSIRANFIASAGPISQAL